jgi:glycosyltransferase involved in cell wall biosynthesis/predicted O-methyltransferase YrrM
MDKNMKVVTIDHRSYQVYENEFQSYIHPEYNNLQLYHQLADVERVVGLIVDMQRTFGCTPYLCPLTRDSFGEYIQTNMLADDAKLDENMILYCSLSSTTVDLSSYAFGLSLHPWGKHAYEWNLSETKLYLSVHPSYVDTFLQEYHWYIQPRNQLVFDNLVHLVMIVKNAGAGFREILEKNLPYIDRWTILDTGSTDNTISIIKETMTSKRGELFQEPFVDFGTTRNRALELAGTFCKFTLMLDDTYYIQGDLRGFLNEIRSDQFADSYSLYITSDDVQYVSNRLLKTNRGLRYLFKIHEVVQEANNINVIVPLQRASICDQQSEYMQTRTRTRKRLDLQLLQESIQEDPDNPRHYYYMAQTYIGMGNWEMGYKYFLQRVYHPVDGFLQEKIDACFEAARTAQFKLDRPWSEVEPLYQKAYEMDPTRPDSIYFLAVKKYMDHQYKDAYRLFKKAFEIGYPLHAQYSLKPTLSYHFTPKFLVNSLCWQYENYELGVKAAELFLKHNAPDLVVQSWLDIYQHLTRLPKLETTIQFPPKRYLCFVADGNWSAWTGRDLEEKGLGGSETYIVEMASWIQASKEFEVVVFCNCSLEERFKGVLYQDINKYYAFINQNLVHTVIVSRFSEYLPVTYKSQVERVYLVVHDISPTGCVLIRHPKLQGIIALTEWHKTRLEQQFSSMSDLMSSMHYGIRENQLVPESRDFPKSPRFIYSSFANRGLLPLLEMWKDILHIFPEASLHVFSDYKHAWCVQHFPDVMKRIEQHIDQPGVHYHGWVESDTLMQAWKEADVWLYPCVFEETFCHTALQAAASRTLVITSDLGALVETVGERGIIIDGDASSPKWRKRALDALSELTSTQRLELLERNYQWACARTWETQANQLLSVIDQHSLNSLEYRGMYNWTTDVPPGSRNILCKIVKEYLGEIVCPRILEIGTYAGTGLIHLMRLLPHSSAVVIDPWKNYDEFPEMQYLHIQESFDRNIRHADLVDRVEVFKSESRTKLVDLVREHQDGFHLIMVDGSHYALDTYADLVLAWELLRPKGLMIIDDYRMDWKELTHSYDCPPEFAVPKEAIDRFVHVLGKDAKVVFKDYRMYLQKQK